LTIISGAMIFSHIIFIWQFIGRVKLIMKE